MTSYRRFVDARNNGRWGTCRTMTSFRRSVDARNNVDGTHTGQWHHIGCLLMLEKMVDGTCVGQWHHIEDLSLLFTKYRPQVVYVPTQIYTWWSYITHTEHHTHYKNRPVDQCICSVNNRLDIGQFYQADISHTHTWLSHVSLNRREFMPATSYVDLHELGSVVVCTHLLITRV